MYQLITVSDNKHFLIITVFLIREMLCKFCPESVKAPDDHASEIP